MAGSSANGPVSVALPKALRARIAVEAKRRGLKLSPAIRALVAERLADLEETETLTRAEQWQRAQAWASWEAAEAGSNPEVDWTEIDAEFEPTPAPRRRRSR